MFKPEVKTSRAAYGLIFSSKLKTGAIISPLKTGGKFPVSVSIHPYMKL